MADDQDEATVQIGPALPAICRPRTGAETTSGTGPVAFRAERPAHESMSFLPTAGRRRFAEKGAAHAAKESRLMRRVEPAR